MPCACKYPVPQYPETADWGPILWTILHGLAERSGKAPLPLDEIREWQKFIPLTADMMPCEKCRSHFKAYISVNPVTQISTIPYQHVKIWTRSFFYTLHNEVNHDNNKAPFEFTTLETHYAKVNFQDLFWRLEPVIKKAIELSGIPLMKWLNWKKSFQMLKASMGV
jgi:hypothetical protein